MDKILVGVVSAIFFALANLMYGANTPILAPEEITPPASESSQVQALLSALKNPQSNLSPFYTGQIGKRVSQDGYTIVLMNGNGGQFYFRVRELPKPVEPVITANGNKMFPPLFWWSIRIKFGPDNRVAALEHSDLQNGTLEDVKVALAAIGSAIPSVN